MSSARPTTLRLYDTYSRSLREFAPLDPSGSVGIYTCGPTVYDYQHIGNYRTFLFEDTLKRVLRFNGYRVRHVMNVTDVGHLTSDADTGEDKMEKGARRTGRTAWEIAALYTRAFEDDLAALNIAISLWWLADVVVAWLGLKGRWVAIERIAIQLLVVVGALVAVTPPAENYLAPLAYALAAALIVGLLGRLFAVGNADRMARW